MKRAITTILFNVALVAVSLLMVPQKSYAILLVGDTDGSTDNLGNFAATINYNDLTSTSATLTVSLTNTTPAANGGFLTAFAFNNPGNQVTGVTFSSSDANFGLIGGSTFNNTISVAPFGSADIGSSTTSGWLGNGSPNGGLAIGDNATFTFTFSGTGLDTLNADSFVSDSGTNDGQDFLVRFRGMTGNGSDKVPGDPSTPGGGTPVPEPATLPLLAAGLLAVAFTKVRFC